MAFSVFFILTVPITCGKMLKSSIYYYIFHILSQFWDYPDDGAVKNLLAMQKIQETGVSSLGQEDPLEEEMATHSNILA